ncbi:MAG: bifunctional ornithine acetyltransferase/N-acetylglutamate synthase protein [Pseudomonadota bacterium]|jgi:glutamate N-acetyltransferase/amino-acid N-acetyltransferase
MTKTTTESVPFQILGEAEASITGPLGWSAGAAVAGIKRYGDEPRYDVGLLVSDRPCAVGGVFTTNKVCGAPVVISRQCVQRQRAQAIVVNSGCSNVAMGQRGIDDARRMAGLAAAKVGIDAELVLVGSTGVIARPLPLEKIEHGIQVLSVTRDGGPLFSRSIMTTDTVPKVRSVRFEIAGLSYTLSGTAKGSGMSHPNMATVFCFVTTDAALDADWLQAAVKRVADETINMVDVDMDTSTSDMMVAFANGAAGGPNLAADPAAAAIVESAMRYVCTELAKDLARDGEGARTLIEAEVRGAQSLEDARRAARTVVSSPLIKTMITGKDPNLGRVLMALGRSGAEMTVEQLSVWIGEHLAFERGEPTTLPLEQISREMGAEVVRLVADLGLGQFSATAWGCDMTEEYVRINADYTT